MPRKHTLDRSESHYRGNVYTLIDEGLQTNNSHYILARVGNKLMCLISLAEGNLWTNPAKVMNGGAATPAEFKEISRCYADRCEWEFNPRLTNALNGRNPREYIKCGPILR